MPRNFKGVWIPANIWLSQSLSMTEKVLITEIDSLSTPEKGCYASNKYLADLLGMTVPSLKNVLTALRKKGILIEERIDEWSSSKWIDFGSIEQKNEHPLEMTGRHQPVTGRHQPVTGRHQPVTENGPEKDSFSAELSENSAVASAGRYKVRNNIIKKETPMSPFVSDERIKVVAAIVPVNKRLEKLLSPAYASSRDSKKRSLYAEVMNSVDELIDLEGSVENAVTFVERVVQGQGTKYFPSAFTLTDILEKYGKFKALISKDALIKKAPAPRVWSMAKGAEV